MTRVMDSRRTRMMIRLSSRRDIFAFFVLFLLFNLLSVQFDTVSLSHSHSGDDDERMTLR